VLVVFVDIIYQLQTFAFLPDFMRQICILINHCMHVMPVLYANPPFSSYYKPLIFKYSLLNWCIKVYIFKKTGGGNAQWRSGNLEPAVGKSPIAVLGLMYVA
jgi:hypothetical protein